MIKLIYVLDHRRLKRQTLAAISAVQRGGCALCAHSTLRTWWRRVALQQSARGSAAPSALALPTA